jgi:hypothetical protein
MFAPPQDELREEALPEGLQDRTRIADPRPGVSCDNQEMNFAERAARNEEVVRDVNQQIEEGAKRHGVDTAMPLHCECGQATCFEKVELSPSRYEQILANRYRFIVVPGHEQAEVERVVEEYESFFIVEKIGDAREQLDQDHPQQTHRDAARHTSP